MWVQRWWLTCTLVGLASVLTPMSCCPHEEVAEIGPWSWDDPAFVRAGPVQLCPCDYHPLGLRVQPGVAAVQER